MFVKTWTYFNSKFLDFLAWDAVSDTLPKYFFQS